MESTLLLWVAFAVFIVGMLALDLFVFHRDAHEVSMREAAFFSAVWIGLGLAFGGLVFLWQGSQAGGEYLAGYVIEKSLSLDNVFVFALIFTYFAVPAKYQHRLLFWGVVGAIVFRAIFIVAGAALLDAFHFLIYVLRCPAPRDGLADVALAQPARHPSREEPHPALRSPCRAHDAGVPRPVLLHP